MTTYAVERQTPRFRFDVEIEVTDLESESRVTGRTRDLGLFGCGINTSSSFLRGARVKVKLMHEDAEVVALGRVAYSRTDLGMGIAFTTIEANDERVLARWIADLASRQTPL